MIKKIIAFDIDDTICKIENKNKNKKNKYSFSKPIKKNIKLLNQLKNKGYKIKLYTARGMSTYNKNLKKIIKKYKLLTINQLDKWNVNYDEIVFGKEVYDYLIDDKAINISDKKKIKKILNK